MTDIDKELSFVERVKAVNRTTIVGVSDATKGNIIAWLKRRMLVAKKKCIEGDALAEAYLLGQLNVYQEVLEVLEEDINGGN